MECSDLAKFIGSTVCDFISDIHRHNIWKLSFAINFDTTVAISAGNPFFTIIIYILC